MKHELYICKDCTDKPFCIERGVVCEKYDLLVDILLRLKEIKEDESK